MDNDIERSNEKIFQALAKDDKEYEQKTARCAVQALYIACREATRFPTIKKQEFHYIHPANEVLVNTKKPDLTYQVLVSIAQGWDSIDKKLRELALHNYPEIAHFILALRKHPRYIARDREMIKNADVVDWEKRFMLSALNIEETICFIAQETLNKTVASTQMIQSEEFMKTPCGEDIHKVMPSIAYHIIQKEQLDINKTQFPFYLIQQLSEAWYYIDDEFKKAILIAYPEVIPFILQSEIKLRAKDIIQEDEDK